MTLNEANSIMEQRKKTENYCLCLCIIPHYHRSSSKICQLLKEGKKKKDRKGGIEEWSQNGTGNFAAIKKEKNYKKSFTEN